MSNAKHTPGPWKAVQDKNYPTLTKIVSIDGDVLDEGFITNREHEVANARLIAAAPEMLEALKAFAFDIESGSVDFGSEQANLNYRAGLAALIAKATGGAE